MSLFCYLTEKRFSELKSEPRHIFHCSLVCPSQSGSSQSDIPTRSNRKVQKRRLSCKYHVNPDIFFIVHNNVQICENLESFGSLESNGLQCFHSQPLTEVLFFYLPSKFRTNSSLIRNITFWLLFTSRPLSQLHSLAAVDALARIHYVSLILTSYCNSIIVFT